MPGLVDLPKLPRPPRGTTSRCLSVSGQWCPSCAYKRAKSYNTFMTSFRAIIIVPVALFRVILKAMHFDDEQTVAHVYEVCILIPFADNMRLCYYCLKGPRDLFRNLCGHGHLLLVAHRRLEIYCPSLRFIVHTRVFNECRVRDRLTRC